MPARYAYSLSSHDPFRGPGAQNTHWHLFEDIASAEGWVRSLYRRYPDFLSPLRTVKESRIDSSSVEDDLWVIETRDGKHWYISRDIIHRSDCMLIRVPVTTEAEIGRCTCKDGEDAD